MGRSLPDVVYHLGPLRRRRLSEGRREGKRVFDRVPSPFVTDLLQRLVGER